MAATTRQPCLYRCVAEANPSPREAPVMTTLRVSAILVRGCTSIAYGAQLHVRATVGLSAHPRGPDPDRIRAGLSVLLVEALRVIDFGLRIRPQAGNRRCGPGPLDDREPCAVREIGEVDYHEHHHEHAQRGPADEDARPLGQLLGHRPTGVVAVQQTPAGIITNVTIRDSQMSGNCH